MYSGYPRIVPTRWRKSYNAPDAAILKSKNCPPGCRLVLIYRRVNLCGNMNVSNVRRCSSCRCPAAPHRRKQYDALRAEEGTFTG